MSSSVFTLCALKILQMKNTDQSFASTGLDNNCETFLSTSDFMKTSLQIHTTLDWYFDAIEQGLSETNNNNNKKKIDSVCLVWHSIGGWVTRAYLGGLARTSTAFLNLDHCYPMVQFISSYLIVFLHRYDVLLYWQSNIGIRGKNTSGTPMPPFRSFNHNLPLVF
jgi:triacylglycerol esterase/lipase EstA (alpha/beta hydrolase family)